MNSPNLYGGRNEGPLRCRIAKRAERKPESSKVALISGVRIPECKLGNVRWFFGDGMGTLHRDQRVGASLGCPAPVATQRCRQRKTRTESTQHASFQPIQRFPNSVVSVPWIHGCSHQPRRLRHERYVAPTRHPRRDWLPDCQRSAVQRRDWPIMAPVRSSKVNTLSYQPGMLAA